MDNNSYYYYDTELLEKRIVLRDQFAMAALTGLIPTIKAIGWNPREMAQEAYRFADAMLEARKA